MGTRHLDKFFSVFHIEYKANLSYAERNERIPYL